MNESVKTIKHAQKESLLLREISSLFMKTSLDDPRLMSLTITRVAISSDKGYCTVYFYTSGGPDEFENLLEILKLYKPSLRTALARSIKARYVPQLIFKFDEQYQKEEKMNRLLDSLKEKGEL